MKKRIFIGMTSMYLGGAERALIGLLHSLDYEQCEVDLFLNRREGELLGDIPSEVNVLPEQARYRALAEPIGATLRHGQVAVALGRTVGKLAARCKEQGKHRDAGITGEYSHKFTKWAMPRINPSVTYDLAISFLTPHYFVAEKVNAKQKIAWIHTDYSNIQLDVPSQLKMWSRYDRIISISDDVTREFVKLFPTLTDKISLIENILPEALVRRQAEQQIPDEPTDKMRLLSIGRLSYPKNFDNIPAICAALVRRGCNVLWEIIGYGDKAVEAEILQNIEAYHMEDHVKLLGKRDNPYPYIKRCDVYVQPSRYEGKAVTVREAQMLGKPVIITAYPTAPSQLEDGVDGIIVPLDNEACAEAMANILQNPSQLEMLAAACRARDYSNRTEAQKLNAFLQ